MELTPRQADIYVSVITMVITDRNTLWYTYTYLLVVGW
jgi:hypothetical protein